MGDASRLARAQGCLLGQIAGDSLGGLVEFRSAEDVARAILLCVTLPPRTVIEEIVMSPTIQRDVSADIAAAKQAGAPPGAG